MESNPKGKRFVTVSEYQRISGLSYKTVMHLLDTGKLKHIKTESGHCRIDTQADHDNTNIMDKIDETQKLVKALCKQFNTPFNTPTGGRP